MINIEKILKDCPIGIKLYSPLYGEVTLHEIDNDNDGYPIKVMTDDNKIASFTKEGKQFVNYPNAECVLFPSEKERTWDKFITKRKDLHIGTACVVTNTAQHLIVSLDSFKLRYYDIKCECYPNGNRYGMSISYRHIIPVDKFDFNDLSWKDSDDYGTVNKDIIQ